MRCAARFWIVGIAALLASCGGGELVDRRKEPTAEDRELREALVRARPDLDRWLRVALLAFEIEPEEALRRQDWVDTHPDEPPGVRALVLRGEVALGMTRAQVEGSLGPPDFDDDLSDAEHELRRSTYRRAAGRWHSSVRVTRLSFEDGRLVDIRESAE